MTIALLQILDAHRDHWLTMEAITLALNQPPQVIHDWIDQLRQMGHRIESVPAHGFRLVGYRGRITSDQIEHELNTRRVGRKILVYQATDSTNNVAWQHVSEPGYDGLAVFAEYQRLGRGRFGRVWSSPPGSSILCSILLQNENLICGQTLSLWAGLATAQAIEKTALVDTYIKWPNDIIISSRKLAGIMVESRLLNNVPSYVIGIGINCSQTAEEFDPELCHQAISLRQAAKIDVSRLHLARNLLSCLDQWLMKIQQGQTDSLHDQWIARCHDIGRRMTLLNNGQRFTGRVIDVSIEEGLLIQLDSGPIRAFDGATTTVYIPPGHEDSRQAPM